MPNPLVRNRAVIHGLPGGLGLMTGYFDCGAAPGAAEATEAAARVRALWESIKGDLNTALSITYSGVSDTLDAGTGALTGQISGTLPTTTAAGSATTAIPWEAQGLVALLTNTIIGGRRVKGRIFIPGFTTTFITAGNPSNTALTDLATAAQKLTTNIVTPITAVVWHRPKGGSGGAMAPITGVQAATYFAALRGRRQ